ncbi:MAG: hypothetical protein M3314_04215 [Actinomycetota bacterium]|nr:hypothetical protein [Actinomycetota bacterium]
MRLCRWRRATVALVLVSAPLLLVGCGEGREARQNVRPPAPGTPDRPSDVQGIYRSIRQGLLQLRGDGEFVLIMPESPGASAGTYTLEEGRLTVQTNVCGTALGEYLVKVGGEQKAGKALLLFQAVSDDCDWRRRSLTVDPWVYADS